MKFKKILKTLYILTPIFILIIYIIDLLSYYSNISINFVSYIRELIIFSILFLWYEILKNKLHFDELSIEQNLVRLTIIILANYIISFSSNTLLKPVYDIETFPPLYQTPGSIFVSNIIAITAAFTFVPSILILRQLIFYKRKRFTSLFFNLFIASITINAFSVFITRESVGWFRFTSDTLFNDLTLILAFIPIIILSFRNEWITYLPRRKKIIYSILGIPLFLGIAFLFDYVYRVPLPAYSLTIAALSFTMCFFLMVYGTLALLKLFFHLPTARAFDRKMKELNSLYDLARQLNSQTQRESLLPLITKSTAEYLDCPTVWLSLYSENNQNFYLASAHNLSEDNITYYPPKAIEGLNLAIIQKRGAVLIPDVAHNRQYASILDWKPTARTIMGAPLFSNRGKLMGIIYATKSKEYEFDIEDVTLLEGIANQAAISLENVKLLEESLERERLEQELRVAREVQLNLLPTTLPQIPRFSIEAFCITAYEVGGDYYDFFQYADGKPGFVIGDVSGKGTYAALYMAEFKGIIQTLSRNHISPAEFAKATNSLIYPNIERRSFISAIFGKIDYDTNSITFVRAGHPYPIYHPINHNAPYFVHSPGIGLGLEPGKVFNQLIKEHTLHLKNGDSLIFFTDGVTEARNREGEEFGDQRLLELVATINRKSVTEIKIELKNSLEKFCEKKQLFDDLTVIIIKYNDSD